MAKEIDIAVVGGGAAGLGAASALSASRARFLLLEARHRLGGRVVTAQPWRDLPVDLGAEWLHSADRNPLTRRLERAGFTIDRTPPHWERQSGNRGSSPEDQAAFGRAFAEFEARLEAAAAAGREGAAASLMEPGGRWNARMNAVSSYYNGAEFDRVSILDYAAYDDSGVNWRVREGYGVGLVALAEGEVQLGCEVSRIDHSGPRLRLLTSQGEVTARAAIVTAPTPLLAEERLAFDPPLPNKMEAAAGLPLGLADKVFIALEAPEALPLEGHLFGDPQSTRTASYNTRPFGRPLIEAFLGGRNADALEAEGEGAMAAFVMDELCGLLGSDFRSTARPIAETAWRRDPFARGAYSHASPGCAGDRARLAEPVDSRLFFAGEATSAHAFSTAHGAWETGERAAAEALAALGLI